MYRLAVALAALSLLVSCASEPPEGTEPAGREHSFEALAAADAVDACAQAIKGNAVLHLDADTGGWNCISVDELAGRFRPEELGFVTRCPDVGIAAEVELLGGYMTLPDFMEVARGKPLKTYRGFVDTGNPLCFPDVDSQWLRMNP